MDQKIILGLAAIGKEEFDLLAYRHNLLTISKLDVAENELRLRAFTDDSGYPDISYEVFNLENYETEQDFTADMETALKRLKEGIIDYLTKKVEMMNEEISNLRENG